MGIEYRGWGRSRRFGGSSVEPPFARVLVPDSVHQALVEADPAPPWGGSSTKFFSTIFEQIFYGYSSKLLTPDDARATAAWLDDWAAAPERPESQAKAGRAVADGLRYQAGFDWYLDWE